MKTIKKKETKTKKKQSKSYDEMLFEYIERELKGHTKNEKG